jgi:hypothetical protein
MRSQKGSSNIPQQFNVKFCCKYPQCYDEEYVSPDLYSYWKLWRLWDSKAISVHTILSPSPRSSLLTTWPHDRDTPWRSGQEIPCFYRIQRFSVLFKKHGSRPYGEQVESRLCFASKINHLPVYHVVFTLKLYNTVLLLLLLLKR